MWGKIKTIVSTSLIFLSGIVGFVTGLFFYEKYLDKPEIQTNIDLGKVKNGNVSFSPQPSSAPTAITEGKVKKSIWKFFKKKGKS